MNMPMVRPTIYCADVGSIAKGNFGWACQAPDSPTYESGTSIDEFAARVSATLEAGAPVALGFECPLFVPLPSEPSELTRARRGEGSRPWSAGAGCGALAVGLTESAWVLARIHAHVTPEPPLFVSWSAFQTAERGILLWEAFVSGAAKAASHEGDALLAVRAFSAAIGSSGPTSVISEAQVFSLIAAAALRAGWSSAAALIEEPCLVVAAAQPL